jgi:hypothetical protein
MRLMRQELSLLPRNRYLESRAVCPGFPLQARFEVHGDKLGNR